MDSKTFDALTRGFGVRKTRRGTLRTVIAGAVGLTVVDRARADVGVQRAECEQACLGDDTNCNEGYRCGQESNRCVAIPSSKDTCDINRDCERRFEVCNGNGRCVNKEVCAQCLDNGDCGSGEVCRSGVCKARECTDNDDCPRPNRQRCRNGVCVRR